MASRRPCKDVEKKRLQLKCINRLCRDGEKLVSATEMMCRYYSIKYKIGKMVCMICLQKSLSHYTHAENLMKKEKCAMKCNFPNFGKHYVIDSSSEDELEPQSNFQSSSSLDSETTNCLGKMVEYCLDKNKDIIEKQIKLCDEYLNIKTQYATKQIKEFDNDLTLIQSEVSELRNRLYKIYRPIKTNESCVDLDKIEKKEYEMEATVKIKKTDKQGCNEDSEEDKTDKDVIIAVNHTLCNVPSDLPKEGKMVFPFLYIDQVVYGMINSSVERWVKCEILNVIANGYSYVSFGKEQKIMNPEELAYTNICPVRYYVGCRVISKYTEFSNIPNQDNDNFHAGVVAEPPTVLNNFRYLIFFDDGRVQYRHHKDIRLIVHRPKEVWKCVKYGKNIESYKEFLQRYLEKYPERHMVKLAIKHNVMARFDDKWLSATVMEVDASLVRLYFVDTKQIEWLYRGSPRLWNIHEKLKGFRMRQSGLEYLKQPFVEFTTVQEEPKGEKLKRKDNKEDERRSSTATKSLVLKNIIRCSETVLSSTERTPTKTQQNDKINEKIITLQLPENVLKPKEYVYHKCNPSCVEWTKYDYKKTKDINVLAIPAHFGFVRYVVQWFNADYDTTKNQRSSPSMVFKSIIYTCPCGRKVRTVKEMLSFLMSTKSKMTIELFDFNGWVNPLEEFKVLTYLRYIDDISSGKEFKKISCVNTFNTKFPPTMKYITSRRPMPGVNINTDYDFLCGCDCTDNCQDKSKCACWQLTIKNQNIIPIDGNEYDPNIGYQYRRLPERVITGIYECNGTCKCSETCLNRVVQQPLSQKLQLFMTEKKGWGVRCLNAIPSGSFICVYVGYLLTENDANHGGLNYGDEYLAELDYIEVVEKTKEGYEKTVQFSDEEINSTKNNDDKNLSETSDDDYQVKYEKANIVVSDIASRLRKRKQKGKSTKKKKVKKDGKYTSPSKSRARVASPEPPKSVRDYFGKNEKVYIMDAKTTGNIGRYINHSCNPNIFVQNVFVDTHDIRFPWVSFFALHYIPAGTELTWDYSYDIGSVPGKKMMCYCESSKCRKRLL